MTDSLASTSVLTSVLGPELSFIEVGKGEAVRRIAVRARSGAAPGLFWLGGWIDVLLARELAKRPPHASLAGQVLITPAPDFTEELMWKGFSPEIRKEIVTKGAWLRPSEYGEPYPITRALIEDGRN